MHPTEKMPGVELAMTVLHAGGKFDKDSYKVSGGLHGVGVSVVNALSEQLKVWVKRDGKEHYMDFVRGDTTTKLKVLGDVPKKETARRSGSSPTTRSSPSSSTATTRSRSRLRELSFLNKGVTITLTDERAGQEKAETFHAKGGLKEFVQHLNANREAAAHRSHLHRDDARRRRHRARDAVQRRLQRERLLVRQQHQHARRRHAPHRLQERRSRASINAYAQKGDFLKKDRLHALRRRRARRADGGAVGEGARAAVRGADQDEARQLRSRVAR